MNENSLNLYKNLSKFYLKLLKGKEKYISSINNIIHSYLLDSKTLIDIGGASGDRILKVVNNKKIDITIVDNCTEMFLNNKNNIKCVKYDICDSTIVQYLGTKFDYATCLWNVFGHISNQNLRKIAIKNIYELLKKDGLLFIDFNNRQNIGQYGINAIKNIVIDFFNNKESNGDFSFIKKIDGNDIDFTTHLFNENEIFEFFKQSGFKLKKMFFINYKNGKIENTKYKGNFFLIMQK